MAPKKNTAPVENEKLMEYYGEMNERQAAAKAAEHERDQEREWAVHNEAMVVSVIDAYAEQKADPAISFAEAIAALAARFHDTVPSYGRGGELREYNVLGFQQKGMLGNMIQNGLWMLDNAKRHENALWVQLDQLEATATGSDIDVAKLNSLTDKIEQTKFTQIPAIEDWVANLKAAHEAIVGEKWAPWVKKGADPKKQTMDAAAARIEALRDGRRPE